MTIPLTPIANAQAFGTWFQRTNDIVTVISTNTVTVDATEGGSVSTGNAFINGTIRTISFAIGNATANTVLNPSSIETTWGLKANSTAIYANSAFANAFSAGASVVNNAGAYVSLVAASSLNVGGYFYANGSAVNAVAITVAGLANVGYVNALSQIAVGTGASLTPTTLTIGLASLNAISLALGSVGSPSAALSIKSSVGNLTLSGASLVTNWGVNANTTALYSNAIFANSITVNNTVANLAGFYADQATINVFTSALTTANSLGLYANAATVNNAILNNISCGLTSANSTALYANNIVIAANVVANTSGVYANKLTTNAVAVGTQTVNTSGVYSNTMSSNSLIANSFTCGVNSANSTVSIANSLVVNSLLSIGNSSINATINSSSIFLGNSAFSFLIANSLGLYTNGSVTVSGNFNVSGNIVSSGTTIGTGDYIPSTNSYNLGNTTNRWIIWASSLTVTGQTTLQANASVANTLTVGTATINSTNYSQTANNTSYVGSVTAANVVSNAQLTNNLANYPTSTNLTNNLANYTVTSGLAGLVATYTANNTSYVGTVTAANVVSNAQLTNNLANYSTTTQMNNNLANYQTSSGLNANIASYLPSYTGVLNTSSISVGTSSVNVTANSTAIKLSNSTVNWTISLPTAAQVTNGQYRLDSTGAWSQMSITSGSLLTTGTGTQNIDSFSLASNYGAEYLIDVGDNNANNRYIAKVLLTHDGTNPYITEYASIQTNSAMGYFESTTNATVCTLNFTPTSTNTTVRWSRILI